LIDDDDRVDDSTLQRGEPGEAQARKRGGGPKVKGSRAKIERGPKVRPETDEPEGLTTHRTSVRLTRVEQQMLKQCANDAGLLPWQLLDREYDMIVATDGIFEGLPTSQSHTPKKKRVPKKPAPTTDNEQISTALQNKLWPTAGPPMKPETRESFPIWITDELEAKIARQAERLGVAPAVIIHRVILRLPGMEGLWSIDHRSPLPRDETQPACQVGTNVKQ
jgi:hypothetical protein